MIVQFGGQTPLNLAQRLRAPACPSSAPRPSPLIWPKTASASASCSTSLKFPSPAAAHATSVEEALAVGERIGYPVLVRPSYVLGGRAMVIAYDAEAVEAVHGASGRVLPGAARPRRSLPRKTQSRSMSTRSAIPKTSSSPASCSTLKKPASTPATRPACCLRQHSPGNARNPPHLHPQAGPRAQSHRPGQPAVRHPARRRRRTTTSSSSK
jgi:hypothetical protein